MDPTTRSLLLSSSKKADGPTYVDDLFSTFLYEGTGSAQTITNGIDLAGEGGLVWFKQRDTTYSHALIDTERGGSKWIRSNSDEFEVTNSAAITSFNSNGFSLGSYDQINNNNADHVAWSFRKAPGFFDVVTYSGTGSVQNIAHSLGSTPGMIMVRCLVGTHDWEVYHRSTGATQSLHLNQDHGANSDSSVWNDTTPTSSQFTVGTSLNVNQSGHTYVAYIFAHDDALYGTDENQSLTHCGAFTSGSSHGSVSLGFEPQWVLIKKYNGSGDDWFIFDAMRGFGIDGSDNKPIRANSSGTELSSYPFFYLTTDGFGWDGASLGNWNYIYMAIRRPHKPPSAGTEVFAIDTYGGGPPAFTSGFPVDLGIYRRLDGAGGNWTWTSRLVPGKELNSNSNGIETSDASIKFDYQDGWYNNSGTYSNYRSWMFRRAPGFYDTVAYTGNNTANQQIPHNLEVAPELIITKIRNSYSRNWAVYSSATGTGKWLELNNDTQAQTGSGKFDSAHTSTYFSVSHDNDFMTGSGGNYVAHLFATLPGISKVGSYTGTGSDIDVDCGFTNGARFVMIKRTDTSGSWFLYDSARGIVSGNDPYLLLDTQDAEVTTTDNIDPLNSGFTVTSSAPAALNTSGGNYIFLAIA